MPHIKRKSKETIDKRLVMAITTIRQGVCMCENGRCFVYRYVCVWMCECEKNKGNPKVSLY